MKQLVFKGTGLFSICIMCMVLFTACGGKNNDNSISNEKRERLYANIADDGITNVIINGNARSVVIEQGINDYFEFYNADLNNKNEYEMNCNEDSGILNIDIMMKNPDADNNILGSIVIVVPVKEFKTVEAGGAFRHIYFETLNSDVLIHANDSVVVLNLEADRLVHNITLEGSASEVFRDVSIYLDKLPDNISMDLNTVQGGNISVPEDLFKENKLESGSGKPSISIQNANSITLYLQ